MKVKKIFADKKKKNLMNLFLNRSILPHISYTFAEKDEETISCHNMHDILYNKQREANERR